ncbi:MAG: DUF2975 domain-containing protein [Bacillota bacterium]
MRHYAYMFLKGITQLMSIPFILWVFMIVTFGFTELGSYTLTWQLIISSIIIFTTGALIPYLYMLFMIYQLLRTLEKKQPLENSLRLLDKLIRSSLYYLALMILSLPFVYMFVERDDSPGLLLLYIFVTGAGFVALAAAYVLKDVINRITKGDDTHVRGN